MSADSFVRQLGRWSDGAGPLHVRLASAIRRSIEHGLLLPGTRMPAERALALSLALSRTTVLTAYNSLRSEGWLESRSGSGTWICIRTAAAARQTTYQAVVSQSSLLGLLQVDETDTIDLAVGTTMPLTEIPREHYTISPELQEVLLRDRNYMPLGYAPLREAVARQYTERGLRTDADQILITLGSQQAISLVTAMYVQRGDTVLVENPTYFGALDAFRFAGARLAHVDVGPGHVHPDELRDRILSKGPRLIYLTPTYQNPIGAVMSEKNRRAVARLCEEFGVPLFEDHTLGELSMEGAPPGAIASYTSGGPIFTAGSLSKLFWAGLRVGWVRSSVSVISQLARVRSATDLGSPAITQAIATQLVQVTDQARKLRREQLRARRDFLVTQLRNKLPEWEFRIPGGGLFLWVRLPGHDARYFAQMAARYRVALTPGPLFAADESCAEFLRIPFLLTEEALADGVDRLAAAWGEFKGSRSAGNRRIAPIV